MSEMQHVATKAHTKKGDTNVDYYYYCKYCGVLFNSSPELKRRNPLIPTPTLFFFSFRLPYEIALINSSIILVQMLNTEPALNATRPITLQETSNFTNLWLHSTFQCCLCCKDKWNTITKPTHASNHQAEVICLLDL